MVNGMNEKDFLRSLRANECTVTYDKKQNRHYVYPNHGSKVIHADNGITIINASETFIPTESRITVMHYKQFKRFVPKGSAMTGPLRYACR